MSLGVTQHFHIRLTIISLLCLAVVASEVSDSFLDSILAQDTGVTHRRLYEYDLTYTGATYDDGGTISKTFDISGYSGIEYVLLSTSNEYGDLSSGSEYFDVYVNNNFI